MARGLRDAVRFRAGRFAFAALGLPRAGFLAGADLPRRVAARRRVALAALRFAARARFAAFVVLVPLDFRAVLAMTSSQLFIRRFILQCSCPSPQRIYALVADSSSGFGPSGSGFAQPGRAMPSPRLN